MEVKVNASRTGIIKEYGAAAGIIAVVKTQGFGDDPNQDPIEIVTFGNGQDVLQMLVALENIVAPTLGIKPIVFNESEKPYGTTVTSIHRPVNQKSDKPHYTILKRLIKYLDAHIL